MAKNGSIETITKREIEAICGGLIAVSIVVVVQLVSSVLDDALTWAVYGFAVAVPLLSFSLLSVSFEFEIEKGGELLTWERMLLITIGSISALVGVAGVFFHLSTRAGLIFSALTFLGMVVMARRG